MSGWYNHLDVLIFNHLFSSTGVVVVAQVNLCWSVFVSIKLSQIGSFHELPVLATECFFSFDIFETQSDIFFWVVIALWFCWRFMVVLSFWFWNFCFFEFLEYVFFLFILDATFCGTIFFHFSGNCAASQVILMFIVAQFISSTGLVVVAEANFRCGFFFVRKKLSSQCWQFFFLFGLDYQTFLEFSQIWKTELPFWVDNAFCTCWCYLGVLNNWFQFFFCGIMSFLVSISDAVFLVTSFSIFDHSVWLILTSRCAHFNSFVHFFWGSGRCTSEFVLECFCLNKVVTNW